MGRTELPYSVQRLVEACSITFGHAKVLAGVLSDPARQVKLAKKVATDGLSVRRLERLVAGASVLASASPAASDGRAKPAYIQDLEEQLSRTVGTRVQIKPSRKKNTGRIIVDYYGLEDFDRISAALGVRPES